MSAFGRRGEVFLLCAERLGLDRRKLAAAAGLGRRGALLRLRAAELRAPARSVATAASTECAHSLSGPFPQEGR